jgi:hypothetical protein
MVERSAEYEAADAAMTRASEAYDAAVKRYRAREIDDKEFLAARKKRDEATAIYDAAHAKERKRGERLEVIEKQREKRPPADPSQRKFKFI